MKFDELVLKRQSCRNFSPKPIEDEVIEKIVKTALLAPSACNSQPWKIHVVRRTEKVQEIAAYMRDFGMNSFVKDAPVLLVVSETKAKLAIGSKLKYDNDHFVKYDVGELIAYLTLAAEAEGVGSCIVGWLNNKKIANAFDFEEDEECNVVIALGYSLAPLRAKKRKPEDEVVKWH